MAQIQSVCYTVCECKCKFSVCICVSMAKHGWCRHHCSISRLDVLYEIPPVAVGFLPGLMFVRLVVISLFAVFMRECVRPLACTMCVCVCVCVPHVCLYMFDAASSQYLEPTFDAFEHKP